MTPVPCPRCALAHPRLVPCSVAIEQAKARGELATTAHGDAAAVVETGPAPPQKKSTKIHGRTPLSPERRQNLSAKLKARYAKLLEGEKG